MKLNRYLLVGALFLGILLFIVLTVEDSRNVEYLLYGEVVGDVSNREHVITWWGHWYEPARIRLLVKAVEPANPLVPVGNIIILESMDRKMDALLPGDIVTFKCHAQLNRCQLVSPVITIK